MKLGHGVSIAALMVAAFGPGVQAQTANTTPANANVLNLLAPFLSLNGTTIGQQTLQLNLAQTIALNQNASPARQQLAVSDRTEPASAGITTVLADGTIIRVGLAGSFAGGLPLQAIPDGSRVQPYQPVGGLGPVLGPIYQTGIRASTATSGPLAATFSLLSDALALNIGGASAGKHYFANGAVSNPTVTPANYVPVLAVGPAGYALPRANGLPNTTSSVYDLAYGVTNTQPGQDVYGSSRPIQVVPNRLTAYDGTQPNDLATSPSFPSGHTTVAYTSSYLLAMLVPQQYQSMLARAADYANDRIVLGVHYPLDIIGSRALAAYDLAQA
ncbi:phosphatase PAP2 family protein, partial [Methylobacterium sp. J-077]|uniref:phosphatase PAP2 family protein n=1 Tax=Methylobacterium sp. J-077 TaxID=2836656 RepID=UPI001FBA720D